jgi:replication fork protection complex subunit Csm3/Swi3
MATDTTTRDTVNSLLNYDVSDNDDDPFREIDTTLHELDKAPNGTKRKAAGSDGKEDADALGIDEEVKITKKRKPVAKLDEARLLSQPGIPKLRALARSKSIASKLHLKGKGHEYSDAAKLLSYYQLWLDNLYPRANFADGLQLVEKVGHGKRMQVMRREWIDEGKPGYGREVEDRHTPGSEGRQNEKEGLADGEGEQPNDKQQVAGLKNTAQDSIFGNLDEGDDDDMFFSDPKNGTTMHENDLNEPDEDELEALLAEQTAGNDLQPQNQKPGSDEAEEDDLDALLAEQPARILQREDLNRQKQRSSSQSENDVDAVLAENEAVPLRQSEKNQFERSSLPAEDNEDELEALLVEQRSRSQ